MPELGTCQLCEQPCSPLVQWHPECWVDYREFVQNDFMPVVRQCAEKQPLLTLYALDPEFRSDINAITIRG